jgi:hypothetical protein
VRTSVRVSTMAAIAAGLMSLGAPAFADSTGNNGLNLLDDNNISVLPVQACPGKLTILGELVPALNTTSNSPSSATCTQTPIQDHP